MKAAIKIISYLWVLAFSTFFVTILYANFVGPLPLALSDYISTFQWALEAFLSSWLFGVFFIVGWFVVSFQMSQKSGWGKIAKHYKCTSQQPDTLKKFYMGSGRVGSIAHNNMLRVAASESGITLKVFFMFRLGHPCLQIPWQGIQSIDIHNSLTDKDKNPLLYAISSKLSWSKYAKILLKELPEQNLIIPWKEEFGSQVPNSVTMHNGL